MLRRDRRRARKRSAQAINAKRQHGLYATWGAICVALVAILSRLAGANQAFSLTIFTLSFSIGIGSLVYAHLMWKREGCLLGIDGPDAALSPPPKRKGLRHRKEDTHREQAAGRGATRIRSD